MDMLDIDGQKALAASPNYFLKWYTLKSLGLVAALVIAAYYLGKAHR